MPVKDTRQARLEASVRYGPQRFALREMLAQALMDRDTAIHAASGAERGIQQAITRARGETSTAYSHAGDTVAGTRGTVDTTLANMGGAGSPFAAAIARERGGSDSRIQESLANALKDLSDRRVQAAGGKASAIEHALSNFGAESGKIQRSYTELAAEEGAFTQGRVGQLQKDRATRTFQKDLKQMEIDAANSRAQATLDQSGASLAERTRHDKAMERKGGTGKGSGKPPRHGLGSLTQAEENSIHDQLSSTVALINGSPGFEDPPKGAPPGTKGPKLTPQRIKQHLLGGSNPTGKPIPADIVEAAFALSKYGSGVLNPADIAALHARGFHVPKAWRPGRRRNGGGFADVQLPAAR